MRRARVPYHLDMQPHPLPAPPSTPSPPRRPPASPPSPTSLDRPFLTGQPGVVMLTFVRHGKQEMPSGSFTPGLWADPPLSELGKRQAAAVGAALAAEPVDAVLCSHLERAAETAREVAAPHGLEPVVYPELREVGAGFCFPLPRFSDIRYQFDLAGGALMDAGCYAVHMVRTFGGSTPEVVSAQAKLRDPRVDRAMTAEVRFAGGHTGRVRASMWSTRLLRRSSVRWRAKATTSDEIPPLAPKGRQPSPDLADRGCVGRFDSAVTNPAFRPRTQAAPEASQRPAASARRNRPRRARGRRPSSRARCGSSTNPIFDLRFEI